MTKILSDGLSSYFDIFDHETSDVESAAKKMKVGSKMRREIFPVNEMTWPEIMRMILVVQCLQQLGETVDSIFI